MGESYVLVSDCNTKFLLEWKEEGNEDWKKFGGKSLVYLCLV